MLNKQPNGLRYLRWGGDGEAVQLGKGRGVEKCLKTAQNPQRQVHALFGGLLGRNARNIVRQNDRSRFDIDIVSENSFCTSYLHLI
jgi:hypothetical protein